MLIFIASNYFSFTMKSQKMKKIFFRLRSLIHQEQKKHGVVENTDEIMAKMSEHFGIDQHQLEWTFLRRRIGFRERFEKILWEQDFPVTVSDIRVAENPLHATAKGALVCALSDL